jgi:hypothetical protein
MNNSESGHTHPSDHTHPSEPQPSTGEPVPAAGSCGGQHASSCGSSPQAEIVFMSSAEATPIAPVTHEVVSAASEPLAHAASAHGTADAPLACSASAAAPVACEASAATPVVGNATALASSEAPKAHSLTEAAANDIAAAIATAQRSRARAKSNSRGPRPSDLIEKKIVIRRDRWDALVQLTETLRSERAVKAEPSEVAAIVLEAGLGAIIEESRNRPAAAAPAAPITEAPKAKAPKAKAALATAHVTTHVTTKVTAKTAKAKLVKKGRASVRKARAPKPTRAAPAKPRSFKADELDSIKRLVRGLGSDRSVQRTLALWLGAHPTKGGLAVPIEDLRSLCREFKVYDTANFAQNMKKDSA